MRSIVVGAFVVVLTLATTGTAAAEHWSSNLKALTLDVQGAGTYVEVDKDNGCGARRVFVRATEPGYKEILAALLSALAADKQISVLITECRGEDSIFMRVQVHK